VPPLPNGPPIPPAPKTSSSPSPPSPSSSARARSCASAARPAWWSIPSPPARSRSTWLLGVGGLPRGRIIEIYGPESSGKTTFCLSVIAEAQRRGGLAAFIDVEHALDPKYARVVGVSLDDLLVSQPDSGEDALNIMEALIRSNSIDVIIIDSVAALVSRPSSTARWATPPSAARPA
jgi:hypothetical protein